MVDKPIIVGSGLAGLWTALQASPRRVRLLTAGRLAEGAASAWAQGGIAAALAEDDHPSLHAADTLAASAGLGDAEAAEALAQGAPGQVRALEKLGLAFERDALGGWLLSREAAHSRRRVARVGGDGAGAAIVAALVRAVRRAGHIEIIEGISVRDLIADELGRCAGVAVMHKGRLSTLTAPAVVLATGGVGSLYAVTTNPDGSRGRALAWAGRLGARLRDLEFVQFHPTALDVDRRPAPLLTEALRGEGALLVDARGERFLPSSHEAAELAPRDVVARAVHAQIQSGRGAFLDARSSIGAGFPDRFPTVFDACRSAGLDPRRDLLPVAPAAHYHMGGVATDLQGRSSVDNLLAVGEVACTGVHGANRLASNALAEALVMGAGAGEALRQELARPTAVLQTQASTGALTPPGLAALRRSMSAHAGVARSGPGLERLLQTLGGLRVRYGDDDALWVARRIARDALARECSAGAHFRTDCPNRNQPLDRSEQAA